MRSRHGLHGPIRPAQLDRLNKESKIAVIGEGGAALAIRLQQLGFTDVQLFGGAEGGREPEGVAHLGASTARTLETLGISLKEVSPFESTSIVAHEVIRRRVAETSEHPSLGADATLRLLHRGLTRRLPEGTLHSSGRLTNIEAASDGRALLEFESGQRATADAVIFTDRSASYSPVQNREQHYRDVVAYRGEVRPCPDWVRGYVVYLLPDAEFTVAPLMMEDGTSGLAWTLFVQTSKAAFLEYFDATPTRATGPGAVPTRVREIVDAIADTSLPPEVASVVGGSAECSATPLVDTNVPASAMHAVGDATVILIGEALTSVFAYTDQRANSAITHASRLSAALAADGDRASRCLARWQGETLRAVERELELGRQLLSRRTRGGVAAWLQAALSG